MRLVVDGVFFQLNSTGIARVWDTILRIMVQRSDLEIILLDRGNAPRIAGITLMPFPAYKAADVAADSIRLQEFCDHVKADAFTSTYYTSPLRTPMVLMVYDMIPELLDFNMDLRGWMEKETAIAFAQRYVSISHSTRSDLLRFYPEINPEHVRVTHCGLDAASFSARAPREISAFRAAQGLDRPYFLFVGSRVQQGGYKNSDLFFKALRDLPATDFDVFCVGGEPVIEQKILDGLPRGVRAMRVSLTDHELSLAYAGAIALVYPSLYEGFGMPVIEAMGSGCPVITTHHGSLAEAAGDAAHLISGHSVPEMVEALTRLQDPAVQADLRKRGLKHVKSFQWGPMADAVVDALGAVVDEGKTARAQAFFAEWSRLRRLQAEVDYV